MTDDASDLTKPEAWLAGHLAAAYNQGVVDGMDIGMVAPPVGRREQFLGKAERALDGLRARGWAPKVDTGKVKGDDLLDQLSRLLDGIGVDYKRTMARAALNQLRTLLATKPASSNDAWAEATKAQHAKADEAREAGDKASGKTTTSFKISWEKGRGLKVDLE